MMKCEDFEFEYTVAPEEISADACEHLDACALCQSFVEQEKQFQHQLAGVINCEVPDGFRHSVRKHVVNNQPQFWSFPTMSIALAASLLMAVGVVNFNKSQYADQHFPLDRLVVEHIEHDGVASMKASYQLSGQKLVQVSQQFGVRVKLANHISFAEKCPIGDSYGLHMVYQSENGPVTIIYMPELPLEKTQPFNYAGLKGWVKPMKQGSIAVVGGSTMDIPKEEFADEVIEWL